MLPTSTATPLLHAALIAAIVHPAVAPAVAAQSPPAVYYSVPSWAPDGGTIAFESNRDGEAAVYTIRPDGTGLTRLTPPGVHGEQPNWAPDGRQIIFTSSRDGVAQLYLMNRDGSDRRPIAKTTNGFLSAFSPDGRWLLFAAQAERPSSRYQVVVMRPDGSARRQLGDTTRSNEDPAWSVDGRRVVFTEVPLLDGRPGESPRDLMRRRRQTQRLVSVEPGGSDLRVLEPGDGEPPTRNRGLSPDGLSEVFVREVEGAAALYVRLGPGGAEQLLDQVRRR